MTCLFVALTTGATAFAKPTFLHKPSATWFQHIDHVTAPIDPAFQHGIDFGTSNGIYGGKFHIDLRVTSRQVTVKHWLSLDFDDEVSRADRQAFQRKLNEANDYFLDGRMALFDRATGKRLTLRTELGFLPRPPRGADRDRYGVEVATQGDPSRAHARRLPFDSWHFVYAHELAHRMLGAEDEYSDRKRDSPTIVRSANGEYLPGLMENASDEATRLMPNNAMTIARAVGRLTGRDFAIVRTGRDD